MDEDIKGHELLKRKDSPCAFNYRIYRNIYPFLPSSFFALANIRSLHIGLCF